MVENKQYMIHKETILANVIDNGLYVNFFYIFKKIGQTGSRS